MKFNNYIPALLLSSAVILFWQAFSQLGVISQYILPTPASIYKAFIENFDVIAMHSSQTLKETIIGLLFAIILGLLVAILLDGFSLVRKAIYPILVTSQTIPMIAIAPLLLVWFGFDMLPKIIIVVLSCFFPIVISTLSGFATTDTDSLNLLKSMKASRFQILHMVKLPGSMPNFFAGLKIAATYSVTGAIVGEYVGAYQGLGIYMQEMAHSHAIALVFAIIAVIAMLSLLLFWVVLVLEKIFIPWNQLQN